MAVWWPAGKQGYNDNNLIRFGVTDKRLKNLSMCVNPRPTPESDKGYAWTENASANVSLTSVLCCHLVKTDGNANSF